MWDLPKGDGFLPEFRLEDLRRMYREEQRAKPKLRLLCAIHRKEGKSIDDIAAFTKMKRRTIHETLRRFKERGINAKDSLKQKGRPPKLTMNQRQKLIERLERGPAYNSSGLWTTKEVAELIRKEFGVKYTHSHVWELLQTAGFLSSDPDPDTTKHPPRKRLKLLKKGYNAGETLPKKGIYSSLPR